MNTKKGFTIIELIVVIAIIAVLAAIVLVNVTSYINKGKDAAIKGNAASIMTNAAAYYDTNGNYGGVISNSVVAAAITQLNTPISNVKSDNTAFCVCSKLINNSANTFCVDSSGTKKETNTACASECTTAGACQ